MWKWKWAFSNNPTVARWLSTTPARTTLCTNTWIYRNLFEETTSESHLWLLYSQHHYLWQQVLNKTFSSYKCQYKRQLFLQCNLITQHIIATHLGYYQRETTFHHLNRTLQSGLAGQGCLSAVYLIRIWFSFRVNVIFWPAGNNLSWNFITHVICIYSI